MGATNADTNGLERAGGASKGLRFFHSPCQNKSRLCDGRPLLRIQKADNGSVRTNLHRSVSSSTFILQNSAVIAKSLFRNILRITLFESRFCPLSIRYPFRNFQRIKILQTRVKKYMGGTYPRSCKRGSQARPSWPQCIVYNLHSIASKLKDSLGTRRPHLQPAPREVETD